MTLQYEPNLLNIVGFIKVDEFLPERIVNLIACIRSFKPVKDYGTFTLCLDRPSEWLFHLVDQELASCEFDYELTRTFDTDPWMPYGTIYMKLLKNSRTDYVLNFIEDHFLVASADTVFSMLSTMGQHECDIMKATFFEVEQKTVQVITTLKAEDTNGYYYRCDQKTQQEIMHLWHRFFLGVNFITTLDFAKKFWDRGDYLDDECVRPHWYEMSMFNSAFEHTVMVPKKEIMASIDDDHGVEGSCLQKRKVPVYMQIISSMELDKLTKMSKPIDLFHINLFNINNYHIQMEKLGNHLHGSIVRHYEQTFCRYVGAKYGCSMNSATSALFLMLYADSGQRIKIPAMIPAVVGNAIINADSSIHFIDNVDWVGSSYEIKAKVIGQEVRIIDSAQKVDPLQYSKEATSENDIIFFSHYPTKPVGSIDGAMVVSNDKSVIDYLRMLSLNGMNMRENNWERTQQTVGHKMYMNSVQAYVANENLKLLPDKKRRLAQIREMYNDAFEISNSSDHLYRIETLQRKLFIMAMGLENIVCGIHYKNLHDHPIFRYIQCDPLPKTIALSETTVSIPFHEHLTNEQVKRIIKIIKPITRDDE